MDLTSMEPTSTFRSMVTPAPQRHNGLLLKRANIVCGDLQDSYPNIQAPVCSGTNSVCTFTQGRQGCCDVNGNCQFYTTCYAGYATAQCSDAQCTQCPISQPYCINYRFQNDGSNQVFTGFSCGVVVAAQTVSGRAYSVDFVTNTNGNATPSTYSSSTTGNSAAGASSSNPTASPTGAAAAGGGNSSSNKGALIGGIVGGILGLLLLLLLLYLLYRCCCGARRRRRRQRRIDERTGSHMQQHHMGPGYGVAGSKLPHQQHHMGPGYGVAGSKVPHQQHHMGPGHGMAGSQMHPHHPSAANGVPNQQVLSHHQTPQYTTTTTATFRH